MSITDYLAEDDGDGVILEEDPAPGETDNIIDEPDSATELKSIPWYIYAIGAGAVIGAGILIFGGNKK